MHCAFDRTRAAGTQLILRAAILTAGFSGLTAPHALHAQGTELAAPRALTPFASSQEFERYLDDLVKRRAKARATRDFLRCPVQTTTRYGAVDLRSRPAVVTGQVRRRDDDHPIESAALIVTSDALSRSTDSAGRFVLPLPRVTAKRVIELRTRAIGYAPRLDTITLAPGDSVDVDIVMCPDANRLSELVVTGTTADQAVNRANVQEAGVDEGGIVKLAGDYLIILRHGQIHTVAVGRNQLRPVASVNAFPPGLARDDSWYDELLVYRDRVIVVGYSYSRGGTEVGVFRLDPAGRIRHEATYNIRSNDYYSSRNYASRLVGSRLTLYAPQYIADGRDMRLPSIRRWQPGSGETGMTTISSTLTAYRPVEPLDPESAAFHSMVSCDLERRDLECETRLVIAPSSRVTYTSSTGAYLWASGGYADSLAFIYRFPFDVALPQAIRARGAPIDQFSFREDSARTLHVAIVSRSRGEGMWGSERARGSMALLRIPLDAFGDGTTAVAPDAYRPVGFVNAEPMQNRFVGEWLIFGEGNGWDAPRKAASEARAVSVRGGGVVTIPLSHGVDRIEAMGGDALVVGTDRRRLHFSRVALDGTPRLRQEFVMDSAAQGELRSHAFFYSASSASTGVFGLPIRPSGQPGWRHLLEGSASIQFIRNTGTAFEPAGSLNASVAVRKPRSDECVASCVDWYGNARPIFLGTRILALLGHELVEGVMGADGVTEVRRVFFTRPPRKGQ